MDETEEFRALRAKWDDILRSEGLGMSRGRRPFKRAVALRDEDTPICSNCTGLHTLEDNCGLHRSG